MDYESTLIQALDLIADGEDRKADRLLQSIIDHAKTRMAGTSDDLDRYFYWGRALVAMEEPEQALLRFEKVLMLESDHEGALWETASVFLHELERPESARALLADKLLPMSPDNALYRESLQAAEFALRLRKDPPNDSTGDARPTSEAARSAGAARVRSAPDKEREKALQQEADALLREAGAWETDDGEI